MTFLNGEVSSEKCCDSEKIISTKNLSLFYEEKKILNNVSLDIYQGCVNSIMGPSGCGKSSFLYSLNKLFSEHQGAKIIGNILLNEKNINSIDNYDLRKKMGMVFQNPTPWPLSIKSNLEIPLKEHGIKNREEIIESSLRKVGLWDEVKDRLKESAMKLSGGQKQRLCMARTLSLNPEILLMDEPCSALDPRSTEQIENLIHELKGDYTIVIVTHNLNQAKRVSDYVSLFWLPDEESSLVENDTTFEIFENPKFQLTKDYLKGVLG